jgi:hypothetical protein
MTNSNGNTFSADIGEQSQDASVKYIIIAENNIRNISYSDEHQYLVIPEFSTLTLIPLFTTITIITLVLRRRLEGTSTSLNN